MFPARRRPSASRNAIDGLASAAAVLRHQSEHVGVTPQVQEQPQRQWSASMLSRSSPQSFPSSPQEAARQQRQPAYVQQPAAYPAYNQHAVADQSSRYPPGTDLFPPNGYPGELADNDWYTSAAAFQSPAMAPILVQSGGDDFTSPTGGTRLAQRPAVVPGSSSIELTTLPSIVQVAHPVSCRSRSGSRGRADVPHERRASISNSPARRSRTQSSAGATSIAQPHDGVTTSAEAAVRVGSAPGFAASPTLEANHQRISSLPIPATFGTTRVSGFRNIVRDFVLFALSFLFDVVPRQIYLHLFLRIPSLYFTRVIRIFEDAQLSLPDIKRMAHARAEQWDHTFFPDIPAPLPPSLLLFGSNWEAFINDLMSDWQTLNVVSVLLMSAILTMLQIDAASHPITRTSALLSLICASMSLLYGCIYIIWFGSMRRAHKGTKLASNIANEAQKTTTSIWWNMWVLLAMPAIWLAWAMLLFFVCIMSFVWLSGSSKDSATSVLSSRAALSVRVALTAVFSLGLIHFVLIVRSFNYYGDSLNQELDWTLRASELGEEAPFTHQPAPNAQPPYMPTPTHSHPSLSSSRRNITSRSVSPIAAHSFVSVPAEMQLEPSPSDGFIGIHSVDPLTTPPPAFFKPRGLMSQLSGEPFRVMQLGYRTVEARLSRPANAPWATAIEGEDLDRFVLDISNAWNGRLALSQRDADVGDHNAGLPAYTLLPPARPDCPFSDGAGGDSVSVSNAFVTGNETETDLPSIGASDAVAAISGFDAPAPGDHSAEHDQSTSPRQKMRAASRSPARSHLGSSSIVDEAPSRSRSRPRQRRSPPSGRPPVNCIAPPGSAQAVREFIALWNERYFCPRNMEASLVPLDDSAGDLAYAINLAVLSPLLGDRMPGSSSSRQTPVVTHVSADVSNNLSPLGLTMI